MYNFDYVCKYMLEASPQISEFLHQADIMSVTGVIDNDAELIIVITDVVQRIIDSKNADILRLLDICVTNVASLFHPEQLENGMTDELRIQYGYSILEYSVFYHMHKCISQFFNHGIIDRTGKSFCALTDLSNFKESNESKEPKESEESKESKESKESEESEESKESEESNESTESN